MARDEPAAMISRQAAHVREALPEWRDHAEQLEALTGDGDDVFSRALKAIVSILDGAGEVEQGLGEKLLEALTVGRDAVMESFDYVSDKADHHLAEMRLRSIDDALNSFSWPQTPGGGGDDHGRND